MIKQISQVIRIFFSAIFNIRFEALKYILLSGLIALILLVFFIWSAFKMSGLLQDYLIANLSYSWITESSLFNVFVSIAIVLFFILILKYIVLLTLSPLLSFVSEKVEKRILKTGSVAGFSIAASTARAIRVNGRNLVKEVILTILLLIASLIPVLNILALPSIFAVQSYFTGFGIMDFYLERHLDFKGTLAEVYHHKWAAITLGTIFILLFAIPLLGVFIAPYVTTVTATTYFIENSKNKNV